MLGNNIAQFKEDLMEEIYQEGVTAHANNQPKSPYSEEPFKNHYWRRGYADAVNPPPEGVWRTYAKYTPRQDMFVPTQMKPELFVMTPDGTPLIRMYITAVCRLTTKEADAFGLHIERLLTEHPFDMNARVIEKDPHGIARSKSPVASTRTLATRAPDGAVRIPDGATFDDLGEIHVPARSLDDSHPDAKKFRRACRAARNAIRAIAEERGQSVSIVTIEMKENS